jgi:Zn-dependent protease with chaperone function
MKYSLIIFERHMTKPTINTGLKLILILLFLAPHLCAYNQQKPVYKFQHDDSLLKTSYFKEASDQQKKLISSLGKEFKDDYKYIYESRFKEVSGLLQSNRAVTDPVAHQYLQSILKKITDVNPELKTLQVRLVFSRDWWPNAYSMGEGTLAVNAGLMINLNNEAELVFVLCHELAHFYLDHSNKAIRKNVEALNSAAFKAEMKRISKQEYNAGKQLDSLVSLVSYGFRRHSRDNEAEADRYAFAFMKRTGYDCNGILTCLRLLDKIDESNFSKPLVLEQVFNFDDYPFKKKWIQKESMIFGQMGNDDSPLAQKEKDSLKTHPDCENRIAFLTDSIRAVEAGKIFIVNEPYFNQLKKDFLVEMTEQLYRDKNLSRNLYYCLLMLQDKENLQFAIYSIARGLNLAYESQKDHRLGMIVGKEGREYAADYNLLLRMFDKIRLNEIADLNNFFCRYYQVLMTGYEGFEEEYSKARKFKTQ